MFNANFNTLIKWLVPHYLFKPKQMAWLNALLSPLVWLFDAFTKYREQKLYDATINSQVIRLTKALRDKFNDQSIYIIHLTDYLDQAFIYLEIEGATVEYDYTDAEAHTPLDYDFIQAEYDAEFDFVVRIPVALVSATPEVKAFVNKYRFSSKRFIIETF